MRRPKRLKMAKPAALAMAEASLIPLETLAAAVVGSPGHRSSSCRRCATIRPTPRPSATSSSCAAGSSARSARASGRTCRSGGGSTGRSCRSSARRWTRSAARRCSCPVLTPAELWEQSGRYDIAEIFQVEDRQGRPFILPMTHEETFTFHAREIRSYRELPQILYHFSVKDRDEPRPRGGLLRVREFIMKDAYSFDRDEEGLERELRAPREAYHRIFDRCGLEVLRGPGRERDDGRQASDRLPRTRPARARTRSSAASAATTPPTSRSRAASRVRPSSRTGSTRPRRSRPPASTTIEALAEFLGIDPAATSKAMPVDEGGRDGRARARPRRRPARARRSC